MTDRLDPKLTEAFELLAALEAKCADLRRIGPGQDLLSEIEALLAEIRDEISTLGRLD